MAPGIDDVDIVADAERENRLLVTYDADLLSNPDALDRIAVVFQPDDRPPAFETANSMDAIVDHLDQQ